MAGGHLAPLNDFNQRVRETPDNREKTMTKTIRYALLASTAGRGVLRALHGPRM